MKRRQTKLQAIRVLALLLNMAAGGMGLLAQQPPGKHPGQSPDQPRKQEAQAAQTDRYGDPLPEGTIARLGTMQLRAVSAAVGISPDGKTIITVTRGPHVKYWEAENGKLHERRELPIQLSDQVHLSADGRFLSVLDPELPMQQIWDISAGKKIHSLPRGYRTLFSPDGKTLAVANPAGSGKSVILVWNRESGERELKAATRRPPDNLAFSPDGRLLAASDGRDIFCWNIVKGEQLWQAGTAFNSSLAFTADGRTVIVSPGHQERAWRAWDAATGKPADGLKLPEGYNFAQLVVAPDNRTLLFAQGRGVKGSDGSIRIWDLREGKMLHTLKGGGTIGPFFPDGKSFLSNSGVLQRWELATGRPMLPEAGKMGHQAEVFRAVYSPDGRRLASVARDGAICLWDVAAAKLLHIFRVQDGHAVDLGFTPEGRFLLSGGWGSQGELYVWDTHTGKEVRRIPLQDPKGGEEQQNVLRLHLMPDGRTVIVLSYSPRRMATDFSGFLSYWDLETSQRKTRVKAGTSDGLYSAFSADGTTWVSRGESLDTATGKVRVTLEGGPKPLSHYAISCDGRWVAGFDTRTVMDGRRISTHMDAILIWNAATGRILHRIPTEWVGQLAFSPDGRYLAAADLQGIRLWEMATGRVVYKLKAHERTRGFYGHSFASCLAFAPDGRNLATGHLDSTILIWDLVPSGSPLSAKDLPRFWDELIGADAAKAYAASWRLVDAPNEAIPFLRERLRPAPPIAAEQVRPLLADLDSDEFPKREAAVARLRAMDRQAERFLREALKASPSPEKRLRLEDLLKDLEQPPNGEVLRQLRAVAVLESLGTTEAQGILKTLSEGVPEVRVTSEAKASVERLTARHRMTKR